jgi:hypothetical protein
MDKRITTMDQYIKPSMPFWFQVMER